MADKDELEEPSLEREFVDSTTLHGVPYIWDNRRRIWLRAFWILAFFACFGTGLWQIWLRVAEFIQFNANTEITLEYKDEIEFPAVTVCNFNRYMASKVSSEDWVYLEYALFAQENDYDSYADDGRFEQSSFDYNALFENSTFNFSEFSRRAGFTLDNTTLLQCTWKGRPCFAENFTHQFTTYGNCWTFNSDVDDAGNEKVILKENQPGSGNGLYMVINIQQDEYTETITGSHQAGLKILAHDQEAPPLMDSLGSAVPPGYNAYVSLRKNEYINLASPWGKCDRDRTLEYFKGYTLSGCFLECRLRFIVEDCECRPIRYPGNARECTPFEMATCVKDVLRRISAGTLGPCWCTIPCRYTTYSTSISYGAYPGYSVGEELENLFNVSVDYQRNNLVVLDIFYEELNFQLLTQQKAMSVSGLISDIGGNLGLFIGASILTFAEFIDYFARKIFGFCTSSKKTGPPLSNKVKDEWINKKDVTLQHLN